VADQNRAGAIGMMSGSLLWAGGTYYDTDTDWALNTNGEYNTILRIPNPGVQPKN
jgi:hypothetical protein